MAEKWRTGRKLGRTIYQQAGTAPADHDELIGVMDTPELAIVVVAAVNQHLARIERANDVQRAKSWPPAPDLVDFAPDTLVRGHWCGCNQPEAVHIWGDAGWCRATLAAVAA